VNKKPTLSIIMANYNYGHYISEALEAILTQSLMPLELIIVDDGSTDNSVDIIERFMGKHDIIKLIRNEKNMGGVFSVNSALDIATGDYVYSAASDDKVLPGFIEKSMAILEKYPQASLCCSDLKVKIGDKYIKKYLYLSKEPKYFSPDESVRLFLREPFTPIISHTTIIKRSVLLEVGGWLPKHKWSCDTFAHHVAVFRYGFCYIPEVLAVMRSHAEQYGASRANKSQLEQELIRTLMDSIQEPQYNDVLQKFERTAPFSVSPWDVLMVALSNKKDRKFLSFKLLRFAIVDGMIKKPLYSILPHHLFNLLRSAVNWTRYIKYIIRRISRMD